jgi:hypothetical protein
MKTPETNLQFFVKHKTSLRAPVLSGRSNLFFLNSRDFIGAGSRSALVLQASPFENGGMRGIFGGLRDDKAEL